MYSLNAQLPEAVRSVQRTYESTLASFEQLTDPLTLVVKRFGSRELVEVERIERVLEEELATWGPIQARVTGFDVFLDPPGGPAPVVYLAVDSPGLEALHHHLIERFGIQHPAVEGSNYVPHVTLARGGERMAVETVTRTSLAPIDWQIDSLALWDARYEQSVTTFHLPYKK